MADDQNFKEQFKSGFKKAKDVVGGVGPAALKVGTAAVSVTVPPLYGLYAVGAVVGKVAEGGAHLVRNLDTGAKRFANNLSAVTGLHLFGDNPYSDTPVKLKRGLVQRGLDGAFGKGTGEHLNDFINEKFGEQTFMQKVFGRDGFRRFFNVGIRVTHGDYDPDLMANELDDVQKQFALEIYKVLQQHTQQNNPIAEVRQLHQDALDEALVLDTSYKNGGPTIRQALQSNNTQVQQAAKALQKQLADDQDNIVTGQESVSEKLEQLQGDVDAQLLTLLDKSVDFTNKQTKQVLNAIQKQANDNIDNMFDEEKQKVEERFESDEFKENLSHVFGKDIDDEDNLQALKQEHLNDVENRRNNQKKEIDKNFASRYEMMQLMDQVSKLRARLTSWQNEGLINSQVKPNPVQSNTMEISIEPVVPKWNQDTHILDHMSVRQDEFGSLYRVDTNTHTYTVKMERYQTTRQKAEVLNTIIDDMYLHQVESKMQQGKNFKEIKEDIKFNLHVRGQDKKESKDLAEEMWIHAAMLKHSDMPRDPNDRRQWVEKVLQDTNIVVNIRDVRGNQTPFDPREESRTAKRLEKRMLEVRQEKQKLFKDTPESAQKFNEAKQNILDVKGAPKPSAPPKEDPDVVISSTNPNPS